MPDDHRFLAQRGGQCRALMCRMTREHEVGGRWHHVKAKPNQSTVQPLSARYHASAALLKPGLVFEGSDGASLGWPTKWIGVEAVLHPGERLDQVGVADRIANPQPGQGPRLGHGLNDQKIRVGGDQWNRGLGAEIDVGLVVLNTNESPLGPSPRALEAIRGEAADTLRLYPDPRSTALLAALATYHQVRPEQVFVGNGSDEVLAHAFAALLKHDAPLLFPDITYSFYPAWCRLFGITYEAVPLDAAMRIRIADYCRPAGAVIDHHGSVRVLLQQRRDLSP
jgi:hypothetical protein